jgi:hypothetical protein
MTLSFAAQPPYLAAYTFRMRRSCMLELSGASGIPNPVLAKFLNPRPRHFLGPPHGMDVESRIARRYPTSGGTGTQLCLRIENPADIPVQIARLSIFPHRRSLSFKDDTPQSADRWFAYKQTGQFRDFVAPHDKKLYHLSEIRSRVWLIIWWHRNRLLNFRFPMILWVSHRRVAVINAEIPDIPI